MDARERDLALSRAWPAREGLPIGPWTARLDAGVTRRANSVLLHGRGDRPPAEELGSWLESVERLYSARGLTPWLQVTAAAWPPAIEDELTARGWATQIDPTVVVTGPLPVVDDLGWDVDTGPDPPDGWTGAWWEVDSRGGRAACDAASGILRRIDVPTVYACVRDDGGTCIGTTLGVLVGGALVLECVTTRPPARRGGVARAATGAVARWAASRSADHVLLAVQEDNPAARAPYEGLGLTEIGRYAYARPSVSSSA